MKAAVVPAVNSSWQIQDVAQHQPGPNQGRPLRELVHGWRILDCVVGQLHIVRTTRNCALPLNMRAYASAALSSG
jgi:hypothetical protein